MYYKQCMHCGIEISYSADVQCRNDVIAELFKEGWSFQENDIDDEWYCPECILSGNAPMSFVIPATVEYRGFTITFSKIIEDGKFSKLRCQIREDEDFFKEIATDPIIILEEWIPAAIVLAQLKIDALYHLLDSTLEKFNKMLTKQGRRQVIDPRVVDAGSVFRTQVDIVSEFFAEK